MIGEGEQRENDEKDKQNEGTVLDELDVEGGGEVTEEREEKGEENENGEEENGERKNRERDGKGEQREIAVEYKQRVVDDAEDMGIIEDREEGGEEQKQRQRQQGRQGKREAGGEESGEEWQDPNKQKLYNKLYPLKEEATIGFVLETVSGSPETRTITIPDEEDSENQVRDNNID